jgi:type II secretory pathway pseudopilin PulG
MRCGWAADARVGLATAAVPAGGGAQSVAHGDDLAFTRASAADVPEVERLVNSAYRGDSSRRGWTTEADLLGGQRTDAEALAALVAAPAGASNWNGPYWKKSQIPKDPWGKEYKYFSPAQNGGPFDILSFGADGKEGGEGENKDVRN